MPLFIIIIMIIIISESFIKYVSNIPWKHKVNKLQKTAILGTAHILRKVNETINQSHYRPGQAQRFAGS